jgi:hypothetical protein
VAVELVAVLVQRERQGTLRRFTVLARLVAVVAAAGMQALV